MIFLPHSLRLRRAARRQFGWASLRKPQLVAMRALMRGRDALVVLPTGAGKSAVYQVPATLLPGPTVVVAPLLALQQDQIAGLLERADPRLHAVRISSAETPRQQQAALDELREGRARFLFITPEQLARPERLREVRALRPALVAVDEAHCISMWGHDFRPDYLRLGHAIRELGRPPVVALTATASPPVRDEVTRRLGLTAPRVVVAGLDRPNLFLEAAHCPTEDHRWRRLIGRLRDEEPPGIVYAPTRRATEELAVRLREQGIEAVAYHAGMSARERQRRHEDFLADRVRVMVATSAFGMGIDKPNIRWVTHVALPDSPDSYLQEIGRAGRDGAPARALLLHRAEDVALQRYFTGGAPAAHELAALATAVAAPGGPRTKAALASETGLGPRRLAQLLSLLELVEAAEVVQGGRIAAPAGAPGPAHAAVLAVAEAERHQTVQQSRIDMMRGFAESRHCRGQQLLAYFGEHSRHACGHCDNCQDGRAAQTQDATVPAAMRAAVSAATKGDGRAAADGDGPYPVHSTVRHVEWGSGLVLRYEGGDRMVVLFDAVGYKTLSVAAVQRNGLLALEPG